MSPELDFTREVAEIMRVRAMNGKPKALVRTYGCQQNVADGEKIKGMLAQMGFDFTEDPETADLVLFNTCAVREHAEDRVWGNLGALKNVRRRHPSVLIGVCGCMMEQAHTAERVKTTFPYVNLVFGPHVLHRLPEMLYTAVTDSTRVFLRGGEGPEVIEGLPVRRDGTSRAWVTVMYGCDNFCSYCVVPYVRGREKSRHPDAVVAECRELIEQGYKEITLLGQNVNSYGKGLSDGITFSELLRRIDAIEGDYRLRFMTSHPKDATEELFDTIAESRHICRHIHLPCQSGNNRILRKMNRRYDREKYLSLVSYARAKMPDISFTTDIIVGFPGETYDEFLDTLSLVREVGFTSLFSFIFSPRRGTKAEKLPDPVSHEEKTRWFAELLRAQEEIAAKDCAALCGETVRVLVEERNEKTGLLSGRMESTRTVEFAGDDALIGNFCNVRITESRAWQLRGVRAADN